MTFPGEMTRAFVGAGLQQIAEATLTIRMEFARFDDYWLPVCTENLIRVDDVMESPELAE